jgi:phage protein D
MATTPQDARPTIAIDGEDRAELGQKLLTLLVSEGAGGLAQCEATFVNWGVKDGALGFLYFDRDLLDFGKQLTVRLGDREIFDGRVMALEGGFPEGGAPELTVLADDRLQDLRMTRRSRTFEDLTDADLFHRIAQDHGLQSDVDVSGPTHRVLAQVNQSDLAFAWERARAVDADLWVEGSTLHAKARAGRGGSPVELTYGSGLRSLRMHADLAHQRTSVVVAGWSAADKRAVRYAATDDAVRAELGDLTSGASVLQDKLGARDETLAHTGASTDDEAQARAEAHYRQSARRFVCGEGVAAPDGALRAGVAVELKGVGPLFEGRFVLADVRWVFDQAGMRVEFRAERPGLGGG